MKNQNKNARTCGRCCNLTLSDSVYRPSSFLAHHYHSHHSPPFSLSPILLHSSIPTRPAPSRAHHQSPKQICIHFHTNLNPPSLPAFTPIFLNLLYHHTSSKPHFRSKRKFHLKQNFPIHLDPNSDFKSRGGPLQPFSLSLAQSDPLSFSSPTAFADPAGFKVVRANKQGPFQPHSKQKF